MPLSFLEILVSLGLWLLPVKRTRPLGFFNSPCSHFYTEVVPSHKRWIGSINRPKRKSDNQDAHRYAPNRSSKASKSKSNGDAAKVTSDLGKSLPISKREQKRANYRANAAKKEQERLAALKQPTTP